MKNGSITSPKGFKASFTAAGIKYKDRPDMAMIYSEVSAVFAGTFTTNKVKAASVKWDEAQLKENNRVSAIIINAGIANAATGEEGLKDAEEIAAYTASKISMEKKMSLLHQQV